MELPKRGRKKGSKSGQFRPWQPKVWKPKYEQIVALGIIGKSNIFIAEQFSMTPTQVSNILNCEKAREIKRLASQDISKVTTDISERLNILASRALDHLEAIQNDPKYMENSPFAVVDRGLRILEGLNHLKIKSEVNITNNKAIMLSPDIAKRLEEGLMKSIAAAQLHSGLPDATENKSK